MTLERLPLFVWAVLVMAILLITVTAGAIAMLLIDRNISRIHWVIEGGVL